MADRRGHLGVALIVSWLRMLLLVVVLCGVMCGLVICRTMDENSAQCPFIVSHAGGRGSLAFFAVTSPRSGRADEEPSYNISAS